MTERLVHYIAPSGGVYEDTAASAMSHGTVVLRFASLYSVQKNAVYFLQLIATDGGYATLSQYGPREVSPFSLKERLRTAEHVSFDTALGVWDEIYASKTADGYERDLPDFLPGSGRYADDRYTVVQADSIDEFRAQHEANIKRTETVEEHRSRISQQQEQRQRTAAQPIIAILQHPLTRLDKTRGQECVIEKQGASIVEHGIDRETARRIAQEIGGSFTARGLLINGRFHINTLTSNTTKDELLRYARPEVVTLETVPGTESTHADALDAVRTILNSINADPIRLVTADDTRITIKARDLCAYSRFFPPELLAALEPIAV